MIRLAVRCRPEIAPRVLTELLEVVPGGVEESEGADWVEYAVYGPPGELPAVGELEAATGEGLVEVTATEIPDDWTDRWRDFHRPVPIAGGRLVVRPAWETARSGAGRPQVEVIVDPGEAFGTGAHATTSMCLELLVGIADEGGASGPLVDLGTGSGVLAITAAKLGWAPVSGCDSERAAVRAATRNAAANGVEASFRRVNLRDHAPPSAPTTVANLTAPLLEEVAGRLTPPPATLVCSGLLAGERDRVATAMAEAGLVVARELAVGEWAALLLRRGNSDQASN